MELRRVDYELTESAARRPSLFVTTFQDHSATNSIIPEKVSAYIYVLSIRSKVRN